jgi:hypothetical protein
MTCRGCGMDNPSNARFCGHCGVSTVEQPSSIQFPLSTPDNSTVNNPDTVTKTIAGITFPFQGTYTSSPNGLFSFGWGLAASTHDRILCMREGQILWQKDLKHVNGGMVADNGWCAAKTFSPEPSRYSPLRASCFLTRIWNFPFLLPRRRNLWVTDAVEWRREARLA